jgi:hypothetical protein
VEKTFCTLLTENIDDDDVVEIRGFGALKSRHKSAPRRLCPVRWIYKTIKDANKSGRSKEARLFDAKELFRSEIGPEQAS